MADFDESDAAAGASNRFIIFPVLHPPRADPRASWHPANAHSQSVVEQFIAQIEEC
jgi:hypothetical protein